MPLATFKHIASKNADYGAAEAYLLYAHDEFTSKPIRDDQGRLVPREDYRFTSLNCGGGLCHRVYSGKSPLWQEPEAGRRQDPSLYHQL